MSPLNAHTFHCGRSCGEEGAALTSFGGRRLGVDARDAAGEGEGGLPAESTATTMLVVVLLLLPLLPPFVLPPPQQLLLVPVLLLLLLLLSLLLRKLLWLCSMPALVARERRTTGEDDRGRRCGDPPPRRLLAKSAFALRGFLSAASWRLSDASPRLPRPPVVLQADSRKDEWNESENQETELADGRRPVRS